MTGPTDAQGRARLNLIHQQQNILDRIALLGPGGNRINIIGKPKKPDKKPDKKIDWGSGGFGGGHLHGGEKPIPGPKPRPPGPDPKPDPDPVPIDVKEEKRKKIDPPPLPPLSISGSLHGGRKPQPGPKPRPPGPDPKPEPIDVKKEKIKKVKPPPLPPLTNRTWTLPSQRTDPNPPPSLSIQSQSWPTRKESEKTQSWPTPKPDTILPYPDTNVVTSDATLKNLPTLPGTPPKLKPTQKSRYHSQLRRLGFSLPAPKPAPKPVPAPAPRRDAPIIVQGSGGGGSSSGGAAGGSGAGGGSGGAAAEDNAVTLEQSKHFEQQCKLSRRPDNKVPESV